jgi:hypothetical protein
LGTQVEQRADPASITPIERTPPILLLVIPPPVAG